MARDGFQDVSLPRQRQLEERIGHLKHLQANLQCGPHRWWQVECAEFQQRIDRLERIAFDYYKYCYDGPGYECNQMMPVLEAQHKTLFDTWWK